MTIRTIFTMTADCARGERQGWAEFVRDYAPIAHLLLEHYFPTLRPELDAHVTGVFQRARAGENAWFRDLRFTNDREFLMAMRELVFAFARAAARVPLPEVSPEQARALLHDLTVVERELLWVILKGYGVPQTASILMNADSTTAAVAELAQPRFAQLAAGSPAESGLGRALTELAERAATPECPPLKVFNNLINGQISWQDRDRTEQHLRDCLYCLDRFTSLQEMLWYQRRAQPLGPMQVERVLAGLGFARRKGLVERLFSRSA
jgi:hypothetical protein